MNGDLLLGGNVFGVNVGDWVLVIGLLIGGVCFGCVGVVLDFLGVNLIGCGLIGCVRVVFDFGVKEDCLLLWEVWCWLIDEDFLVGFLVIMVLFVFEVVIVEIGELSWDFFVLIIFFVLEMGLFGVNVIICISVIFNVFCLFSVNGKFLCFCSVIW